MVRSLTKVEEKKAQEAIQHAKPVQGHHRDNIATPEPDRRRLGDILEEMGVPRVNLELAAQEAEVAKRPLGHVLLDRSLVHPEVLAQALSVHYASRGLDIPHFDLVRQDLQNGLPSAPDLVESCQCIPIRENANEILIGMLDPLDKDKADKIARFYHAPPLCKKTKFAVISQITYRRYLEMAQRIDPKLIQDKLSAVSLKSGDNKAEGLLLLLKKAVMECASDIHIEPTMDGGRILLRRHGVRELLCVLTLDAYKSLVNMVKMRGGHTISSTERRKPQDGRMSGEMLHDEQYKAVDFRVSTMPMWGNAESPESIVIRVLDRRTSILPLSELGMPQHVLDAVASVQDKSSGLLIFTGPTGSGKSTSIYSALSGMDTVRRAVITAEDPVECRNYMWKQAQVDEAHNVDYQKLLKHTLRHDPDVIYCGEMRDPESAHIACEASNTGHLVLSTLHANNAVAALTRLQSLGLSDGLIQAALIGIVAQRLVRVLCSCKKPAEHPEFGTIYEANGCAMCNYTGYSGRCMVAEYMPISSKTHDIVDLALSGQLLKARSIYSEQFTTIHSAAIDKVKQGITSLAEVRRVVDDE